MWAFRMAQQNLGPRLRSRVANDPMRAGHRAAWRGFSKPMSPLRDYEGRIRRSTPCWVPGDALLAQQSVTPGFLPGAGGLAWGLESPGQSSTWRILLRFTEAGTGGCGEVDRVARLIARKPSPKPEIVRRVTGGRSPS